MRLHAAKRREYFNLPNYLTLGRIALIPVVMVLLAKISPGKSQPFNFTIGLIASGVFILAGLSDLVDGYYARKHQIDSIFGKYFDPLADKLMVLAVMIMLIPLDRIPSWIVVVFLAREFTITALRGIATGEGLELPADSWGKKKTVLQNIALVALMIHYPIWGANAQAFGWIVLLLALVVAIFSGVNYVYRFSKEILARYPKGTA
jgi:CDP-diacylglycerol--glycerol-3-phosphate 3-phosphatidyltransferase